MADQSGNTVVNRGNTPRNARGAQRSAADPQAPGGATNGGRLREVAAHLRRIGTLNADAQAELAEAEALLSDQAPDHSDQAYWEKVKTARTDRPAGIPYHGTGQ